MSADPASEPTDGTIFVVANSPAQAEAIRTVVASGLDDLWFASALLLHHETRKGAENALGAALVWTLSPEDRAKAMNMQVYEVVRPGHENYRTPDCAITEAERAVAVRLGLDPQRVHEVMDAFGEEAGRIARTKSIAAKARRAELLRYTTQQEEEDR